MELSVGQPQRISKIIDKNSEPADLLPVWLFMAPVEKGNLLPVRVLRHGFIGRQHTVLDQHRRRVPLIGLDLLGPALFIQHDLAHFA